MNSDIISICRKKVIHCLMTMEFLKQGYQNIRSRIILLYIWSDITLVTPEKFPNGYDSSIEVHTYLIKMYMIPVIIKMQHQEPSGLSLNKLRIKFI